MAPNVGLSRRFFLTPQAYVLTITSLSKTNDSFLVIQTIMTDRNDDPLSEVNFHSTTSVSRPCPSPFEFRCVINAYVRICVFPVVVGLLPAAHQAWLMKLKHTVLYLDNKIRGKITIKKGWPPRYTKK